jgi:hypothetical protein
MSSDLFQTFAKSRQLRLHARDPGKIDQFIRIVALIK